MGSHNYGSAWLQMSMSVRLQVLAHRYASMRRVHSNASAVKDTYGIHGTTHAVKLWKAMHHCYLLAGTTSARSRWITMR